MRILFLTQGVLVPRDQARVRKVVQRYVSDTDVEEAYFGFTEETTEGAIFALDCAVQARPTIQFGGHDGPLITSVVPHRAHDLSADARHAFARGDQVLEMTLGEGRTGYNRYSSKVIELVQGIGQVVVFWDGRYTREPWDTIRRLRSPSSNPILFELYDLEGPDMLHGGQRGKAT